MVAGEAAGHLPLLDGDGSVDGHQRGMGGGWGWLLLHDETGMQLGVGADDADDEDGDDNGRHDEAEDTEESIVGGGQLSFYILGLTCKYLHTQSNPMPM